MKTICGYPVHPVANKFPMIAGSEFESLKQDIELRGLRYPIELLDGKIIDGRNRALACQELGIKDPDVVDVTIKTGDGEAA